MTTRLRRISHLGLAVNDLEAAIHLYRDVYGLELEHRWVADSDGMEAATFRVGDVEIELMQPRSEDSPVGRFLARRGEGVHHVAFKVDDVAGALAGIRDAGLTTIDSAPREGGDGRTRIGFLHPQSTLGMLTELEEDVPAEER
ncbi:MAG: methylmalonyl-CoA epimerase [Candidatus Dormibacteraeota bacterium]|nr:methylmalonyl-CoA epimerase [Candidatus Dormibacteraeota bacterium]